MLCFSCYWLSFCGHAASAWLCPSWWSVYLSEHTFLEVLLPVSSEELKSEGLFKTSTCTINVSSDLCANSTSVVVPAWHRDFALAGEDWSSSCAVVLLFGILAILEVVEIVGNGMGLW